MRFLTDYSESTKSNDTAISSSVNTGSVISAVALNKNKVFIAFSFGSPYYLYGAICTINGTTITREGTTVELSSITNSGKAISVIVLSENKVLIAHSREGSFSLYAQVCTISGTTITCGTDTALSSVANSGKVISAVKLDEGRVLIVHSYGANYYLYGIVCTISGTTVIKGADTQLGTIVSTGSAISVVTLNENKVFIAHRYGNNRNLYGLVCTISGTTITKGTDTDLSVSDVLQEISTVVWSKDKVFIIYSRYKELTYTMCTIDGTTITGSGFTNFSRCPQITENTISAMILSENKILVIFSDSNKCLYRVMGTITTLSSGSVYIEENTPIQLSSAENSGSTISAVALSENNIFIGHSFGANIYLYGMVLSYLSNLVKTITSSTEQINGIAITDGQAGETVSVKVPNV